MQQQQQFGNVRGGQRGRGAIRGPYVPPHARRGRGRGGVRGAGGRGGRGIAPGRGGAGAGGLRRPASFSNNVQNYKVRVHHSLRNEVKAAKGFSRYTASILWVEEGDDAEGAHSINNSHALGAIARELETVRLMGEAHRSGVRNLVSLFGSARDRRLAFLLNEGVRAEDRLQMHIHQEMWDAADANRLQAWAIDRFEQAVQMANQVEHVGFMLVNVYALGPVPLTPSGVYSAIFSEIDADRRARVPIYWLGHAFFDVAGSYFRESFYVRDLETDEVVYSPHPGAEAYQHNACSWLTRKGCLDIDVEDRLMPLSWAPDLSLESGYCRTVLTATQTHINPARVVRTYNYEYYSVPDFAKTKFGLSVERYCDIALWVFGSPKKWVDWLNTVPHKRVLVHKGAHMKLRYQAGKNARSRSSWSQMMQNAQVIIDADPLTGIAAEHGFSDIFFNLARDTAIAAYFLSLEEDNKAHQIGKLMGGEAQAHNVWLKGLDQPEEATGSILPHIGTLGQACLAAGLAYCAWKAIPFMGGIAKAMLASKVLPVPGSLVPSDTWTLYACFGAPIVEEVLKRIPVQWVLGPSWLYFPTHYLVATEFIQKLATLRFLLALQPQSLGLSAFIAGSAVAIVPATIMHYHARRKPLLEGIWMHMKFNLLAVCLTALIPALCMKVFNQSLTTVKAVEEVGAREAISLLFRPITDALIKAFNVGWEMGAQSSSGNLFNIPGLAFPVILEEAVKYGLARTFGTKGILGFVVLEAMVKRDWRYMPTAIMHGVTAGLGMLGPVGWLGAVATHMWWNHRAMSRPVGPDSWAQFREDHYRREWEDRPEVRSDIKGEVEIPPSLIFIPKQVRPYCDAKPLNRWCRMTDGYLPIEEIPSEATQAILPTQIPQLTPARSDANLHEVMHSRVGAAPPAQKRGMTLEEVNDEWEEVPELKAQTEGTITWTEELAKAWIEAHDDRVKARYYKAELEALIKSGSFDALGRKPVSIFVKTNEMLLKMEEGHMRLRPRSIANVDTRIQVVVGPVLDLIRDRLKARFPMVLGETAPALIVGETPIYVCYASGITPDKLTEWARSVTEFQGPFTCITAAGDDSIVVVKEADGSFVVYEGDAACFDQSQLEGALEYEYRVLQGFGMEDWITDILARNAIAPCRADYKQGTVCILDRHDSPFRDTGGPETSDGNTITISGGWLKVMSENPKTLGEIEEGFCRLGFEMKLKKHNGFHDPITGGPTFLKGWFLPGCDGVPCWAPLPSRVLKFGKSGIPTNQIYRGLLIAKGLPVEQDSRLTSTLFLRDVAGSWMVPHDTPLLDEVKNYWVSQAADVDLSLVSLTDKQYHAFVLAMAKSELEVVRTSDGYVLRRRGFEKAAECSYSVDRAAALDQYAARYGLRENDISEMVELFSGPVFRQLYHPGFLKLAADYS